jgi:hypothetical protein
VQQPGRGLSHHWTSSRTRSTGGALCARAAIRSITAPNNRSRLGSAPNQGSSGKGQPDPLQSSAPPQNRHASQGIHPWHVRPPRSASVRPFITVPPRFRASRSALQEPSAADARVSGHQHHLPGAGFRFQQAPRADDLARPFDLRDLAASAAQSPQLARVSLPLNEEKGQVLTGCADLRASSVLRQAGPKLLRSRVAASACSSASADGQSAQATEPGWPSRFIERIYLHKRA